MSAIFLIIFGIWIVCCIGVIAVVLWEDLLP